MGYFFTDTMRDSNSHEFEEIIDPITCTPNEEPEENIVEIDETFLEKESSVLLLCFIMKPMLGNRYGPGVIP